MSLFEKLKLSFLHLNRFRTEHVVSHIVPLNRILSFFFSLRPNTIIAEAAAKPKQQLEIRDQMKLLLLGDRKFEAPKSRLTSDVRVIQGAARWRLNAEAHEQKPAAAWKNHESEQKMVEP